MELVALQKARETDRALDWLSLGTRLAGAFCRRYRFIEGWGETAIVGAASGRILGWLAGRRE